jgi:hypothetical protein
MPGRSSTVHLSARNCLDVAEHTDFTMVGRFTGKRMTGCPILDPLARPTPFSPGGTVRFTLNDEVPSSCDATGLQVSATFTGTPGRRLAERSTRLAIT